MRFSTSPQDRKVPYIPPKALENYYQEAGRAGRDGLPARCILFHTPADKRKLTRWTGQDALHVEFLRDAYAAVQVRLGGEGPGLIAVGDLERDLQAEETHVRVAIHFLETAGLLWRGFDLPRTSTLNLRRPPDGQDPDLVRFVEAARLRQDQVLSRDLLALSRAADLDPRTIEAQVLAWEDGGWLRFRGIGRDMLLALPDPPPDSRERVAAMLADYRAGQDGRIGDMMAYAITRRCRHGYISAYFGGRPIERCQSCDNCLGLSAQQPPPRHQLRALPMPQPVGDPVPVILEAITQLPFALGRTGLARALQGASTSPVQVDRFPAFGALANHTQKSIGELVMQLVDQGLLAHFEKGRYTLLRLTEEGQAWLEAHRQDPDSTVPPLPPIPEQDAGQTHYDEVLFEELRVWRLETAREIDKPPFVVFHNAVLERIAAHRPTTLDALVAIKGIGPRKLEQYGQAVLAIVASHEPTLAGEAK